MVQDRWVELRGLRLHYREWSTRGQPMVLLHGLASQSHIYDLVAPRLARDFRVVALDQRGHGESSAPESGYDFENVVADLRAFLDALKFKRTVLVGHSWGGNVAVQFAARHPDRTSALVLIDGGFIDMQSNPEMTWEVASQRLAPPRLAGTPLDVFRNRLKSYVGKMWSPAVEQVILDNFQVFPDQTIQPHLSFEHHMLILRALWEQRPPLLYPSITCPVLMLPAHSDSADPGERAFLAAKQNAVESARRTLANSQISWFRHTVHDIPLHRPRKLANEIIRFAIDHRIIRKSV